MKKFPTSSGIMVKLFVGLGRSEIGFVSTSSSVDGKQHNKANKGGSYSSFTCCCSERVRHEASASVSATDSARVNRRAASLGGPNEAGLYLSSTPHSFALIFVIYLFMRLKINS